MTSPRHVPIQRKFAPISEQLDESEQYQISSLLGYSDKQEWSELEKVHRAVILAEAGIGKTYELYSKAEEIRGSQRYAFFIRIEDIDSDFKDAFEIGNAQKFDKWLESTEEAWFFLDSVDEAKLKEPRAFKKALTLFSKKIKNATQRARIYITSRPYAWDFSSDLEHVIRCFPFCTLPWIKEEEEKKGIEKTFSLNIKPEIEAESPFKMFLLRPLTKEDVKQFAEYRETPYAENLISEIERLNLLEMASHPYDLEAIINNWKDAQKLGSRLEVIQNGIALRLTEQNPDVQPLRPLNNDKAREGAQLLATALTLSEKSSISIPGATPPKDSVRADEILSDWEHKDILVLLQSGVFNDILYGAVRFRHREIRELLTVEWFACKLKNSISRKAIESLIIKKIYGRLIITPSTRPFLPWLILFDDELRQKVLDIEPEIALESGDISNLPYIERKAILNDIVERIASNEGPRSARNNSAIARIAQGDLAKDVLPLIHKYTDNDDVIFFLSRLIWQGKLTECIEPLGVIALDINRGIYARIASIRAIFTTGDETNKVAIWEALLNSPGNIPHALLSEILQDCSITQKSIELILQSLRKLSEIGRFDSNDVTYALNNFITRYISTKNCYKLLKVLMYGMDELANKAIDTKSCAHQPQQKYDWLFNSINDIACQLVDVQSPDCFEEKFVQILTRDQKFSTYYLPDYYNLKSDLNHLVPAWPKLNDYLFWYNYKKINYEENIEPYGFILAHDLKYYRFPDSSFERVVEYISSKENTNDKHIALSLALRIFKDNDKPEQWKTLLEQTVVDSLALSLHLEKALNSMHSEQDKELLRENEKIAKEDALQKQKERQEREEWVAQLKTNPDLMIIRSAEEPDAISNAQYHLWKELNDSLNNFQIGNCRHWKTLAEEFNEEVAITFKDSAIEYWKSYTPEIGSENGNTRTLPFKCIFALYGIHISPPNFYDNFSLSEVEHLLRYSLWELNGLPSWLEAFYKRFPDQVTAYLKREIEWEVNTTTDEPKHYVLQDIANQAPWFYSHVTTEMLSYLKRESLHSHIQQGCLKIITKLDGFSDELEQLAKFKISQGSCDSMAHYWFALWVDINSDDAIPALTNWLNDFTQEEASKLYQLFITTLISGHRHNPLPISSFRAYETVQHLQTLFNLSLNYIKLTEDIDRAKGGVYTPEIRDDAQRARDQLLHLLSLIPGKETYIALESFKDKGYHQDIIEWSESLAMTRAQLDANIGPWSVKKFKEFTTSFVIQPSSSQELFDIGKSLLEDFKDWLENGNDSRASTYARVTAEDEMRNIIAGELQSRQSVGIQFVQELTLANNQRIDIALMHSNVRRPIPIELKLLNQGWSGDKLYERLRNQLAGDYLREANSNYGIYLLVYCGSNTRQSWVIDGTSVSLPNLEQVTQGYWEKISKDFPKINDIQVLVLDLTKRSLKSDLN